MFLDYCKKYTLQTSYKGRQFKYIRKVKPSTGVFQRVQFIFAPAQALIKPTIYLVSFLYDGLCVVSIVCYGSQILSFPAGLHSYRRPILFIKFDTNYGSRS